MFRRQAWRHRWLERVLDQYSTPPCWQYGRQGSESPSHELDRGGAPVASPLHVQPGRPSNGANPDGHVAVAADQQHLAAPRFCRGGRRCSRRCNLYLHTLEEVLWEPWLHSVQVMCAARPSRSSNPLWLSRSAARRLQRRRERPENPPTLVLPPYGQEGRITVGHLSSISTHDAVPGRMGGGCYAANPAHSSGGLGCRTNCWVLADFHVAV
jgi:hypothetical protein